METTKIIATTGLQVIKTDTGDSCIISQIHPDSYCVDCPDKHYSGSANITDIKGMNGEIIEHPNFIGSEIVEKDTYILVTEGSEVHTQMREIFKRRKDAQNAAFELIRVLGGDAYFRKQEYFAGGIEAIQFPNGKPNNSWKKYSSKRKNSFIPPMSDVDLQKKLNELPIVKHEEMNNIYGFPTGQFVSDSINFMPGIHFCKEGYILEVVKGCLIAIKEGMHVISKSQFYALKGE